MEGFQLFIPILAFPFQPGIGRMGFMIPSKEAGSLRHQRLVLPISQGIQATQMILIIQQRLVLMLPMHIHQHAGKLPQLGQRHRRALDPAYTASALTDLSGENQGVLFRLKIVLVQPGAGLGTIGYVKKSFGISFFASGANQLSVRTAAQQQVDGIHHDGFARARLAGQHMQTFAKGQFDLIDQGDVFNQ